MLTLTCTKTCRAYIQTASYHDHDIRAEDPALLVPVVSLGKKLILETRNLNKELLLLIGIIVN